MTSIDSTGVGNRRHTLLHLHAIARIVIHADSAGDAFVFVAHVIAHQLGAGVVDGVAVPLHGGRGVGVLTAGLDAIAGVTTAHRTGHRRQRLALATTDLVAQQAASHGADRGTRNAVLVLGRRGVGDHFVLAHLPGVVDGLAYRIDAHHLSVVVSLHLGHRRTRSRAPVGGRSRVRIAI